MGEHRLDRLGRAERRYWDRWYGALERPVSMGKQATYRIACGWLDLPGAVLEDWGGGTGYAGRFVQRARYVLVDGSASAWNPEPTELAAYRSDADCILIRHVLEHNHDWAVIWANAAASYRVRLALVLFTPLADVTCLQSTHRARVPVYRFAAADLEAIAGKPAATRTAGPETVWLYER